MAVVNVTFPGNLAQVDTADDLRGIPSALIPAGTLYLVSDLRGIFEFESGSLAPDDDLSVIRPDDRTPLQAGRWLKDAEGLAPGKEGDTGPADNTYTTYAALLASDPLRKSARLVPQTGEAEPAGNFNYIGGAWVRQAASGLTFGVKSYGAKGDGTTNDAAVLQTAINATGGTGFLVGGGLDIPRGQYRTMTAMSSAQFWMVRGDGQLSSYFANGGVAATDLFSNAGFGYVDYENLGARNYRSFLKSTGQVESVGARNLHVFNQTGYAFDVAGNFLVAKFDKMTIDGNGQNGSGGIRCGGSFNNFELGTPQFLNLKEHAFDLVFSEGVLTTNMRVEGGNPGGKSVFKLAANTHQHIVNVGGYIEGAQEYIVSADGAGATAWNGGGTLSFIGTHFTYWLAGVPHKWAVTSPVPLLACDFSIPTRLPPSAQPIGYNHNLIRAEYVSHTPFVSKKRRPASVSGIGPWVQDVVVFTRPAGSNTPANVSILAGHLYYTASWSNPDGGASGSVCREYQIMVRGRGTGNVQITVTPLGVAMDDGNGSTVLTIAASGAPSTTAVSVIATWNGVNPTVISNFDQQFSLVWNQSAGIAENTFAISEPGS